MERDLEALTKAGHREINVSDINEKSVMENIYIRPLEILRPAAEKAYQDHNRWRTFDGWVYNIGTALVLLFITFGTILPTGTTEHAVPWWLPKLLSGLSAAWIAIDRALVFGMRWRFHVEMVGGYQMLINRIDIFEALPCENQKEAFDAIVSTFEGLQRRESSVPGSGVSVQDAPKDKVV